MQGARCHAQNMYLKPNGKDVIIETRDGESHEINNKMFYTPKRHKNKFEDRLDIYHGANNYLFMRGTANILDLDVLDSLIKNKNIDVNNVAYTSDMSSNFTWDHKQLVEIKKLRRRVSRFYRPTAKVLTH